jgi:aminoglycoside 6'-N-acetyltransferase I
MTIRAITNNDIEGCARLLINAYQQPPWRYQWNYEKAMKYLTEYRSVKQFIGFVLLEGEEIAGALFAHQKTWWMNDQLFVDELFISSDKQRSGYGKKLLEHAEQYAASIGLKSISLMTNKFSPAFNFYLKLDYFHAEHFVFLFKEI